MKARIWLPMLLALWLAGCERAPSADDNEGRISHIVLCWLNEPGNEAHRQEIIETSKTFREIPGVLDVRAGRVIPSDREIVDDSFDVCMSFTFASRRDMADYIAHPMHKKALEEVLLPLVRKIVVYDFVE